MKLDKVYTLQELRNLVGPECSGKTLIGLQVTQELVKNGYPVITIDREHELDPEILDKLGLAPASDSNKT